MLVTRVKKTSEGLRRMASTFINPAKVSKTLDPNFSKVLLVGGGLSGLLAAYYLRHFGVVRSHELRLVTDSTFHHYTPLLNAAAFELTEREEVERPILSLANEYSHLDFDRVVSFDLKNNRAVTANNKTFEYDYLVLAGGTTPDFERIQGLSSALADEESGVVSIHDLDSIRRASNLIHRFWSGRVLFYHSGPEANDTFHALNQTLLFDDFLRKKGKGLRNTAQLQYVSASRSILDNAKYSLKVKEQLDQRNIAHKYREELVKVDAQNKVATFKSAEDGKLVEKQFDLLFVDPPRVLPKELVSFAGADGRVDVDPQTLAHRQHQNVFALGHCSPALTYHSLAAFYEQALVMSANLGIISTPGEKNIRLRYNGYTRLPLFLGGHKVLNVELKKEMDTDNLRAVSYTHLTLPTIYSV
eukprot:TRINITY_DN1824_c0_g1_i7.p1 TRINITY_DN1824_c0_g1~~TRINITY_DN1824_c0_g1_i7.p1  ORF type:complete len:415 (-),score=87.62 TRINITY_DN1824_c0_g1_i7:35-1279(-)